MVTQNNNPPSTRWQEIDRLFHAVMDVEPRSREAFLVTACRDPAIRAEVKRLMIHSDCQDDFLHVAHRTDESSDAALSGRMIGQFEIERQIGEGGMATVWLARRREASFEQRVALKVMRWGPVSSRWRQRFASERQTLARLEHPFITRMFDGGTADALGDELDGLPYLVMEYVEGQPISRHADAHRLTIAQRLSLFCKVCEAVHYAHQNLVVHRDLKPGNILVTPDGNPKLLDFGIAKLLEHDGDMPDGETETMFRALTPRYASPEQVRGETITTASDIYSLGIMLYELLTGRQVYALQGTSRYEQERIICETEPAAPSLVVDTTPSDVEGGTESCLAPGERAALRGENQHGLRRRLRGDLDNIVLMALNKDPERRYATVQQFREDIIRYSSGLPVIARKDTRGYRIRKFISRNRSAVTLALAVTLTLAMGILGTWTGWREAQAERDVAKRVSMFMQDVLASANPFRISADPYRQGQETNVLDLLAAASRRVTNELRDQPAAAAAARYAIAEVYGGLWHWEDVEPQVRMALDTYRTLHGSVHADVAKCLTLLGRALSFRACPESVAVQREGLAIRLRLYGENHPRVAESKVALAFSYWAASDEPRWKAAERLYLEALATYRSRRVEDDRTYARALFSMAAMYIARGDVDRGTERLLTEAVEVYRGFPFQEDRYLSECLRVYAELHRRKGRVNEEAVALEESLAITPSMFMAEDKVRRSAWRRVELAAQLEDIDDFHRCMIRAMRAECARWVKQTDDDAHWTTFSDQLGASGDASRLTQMVIDHLNHLSERPCPWEFEVTERLVQLAPFITTSIDRSMGLKIARLCLDYQLTRFPYRKLTIAHAQVQYGRALMDCHRYEEAEEQLYSAYKTIHPQVRNSDFRHVAVVEALMTLYQNTGRVEQAQAFRPKLPPGYFK
ncbi:MAG: protein kinase domain-containing protein [Phycisphaerae bacterium]